MWLITTDPVELSVNYSNCAHAPIPLIFHASGFVPVIIPPKLVGDELCSDIEALEASFEASEKDSVVAVMSTTSCFAPRACDDLAAVSAFCTSARVPHIVNNAYGMNSFDVVKVINKAIETGGRIDCIVQSCDKNFMVPVGGAIVTNFITRKLTTTKDGGRGEGDSLTKDLSFCDRVAKTYPGRASLTPSLDVIITLLSVGSPGYKSWLNVQKETYRYLKDKLDSFARGIGERLLQTPHNPISIAMTLTTLVNVDSPSSVNDLTEIGSMLFKRRVTGARVVVPGQNKTIKGHDFIGWGSHYPAYPHPYLTVAAAIGMTPKNADDFIQKLDRVLKDYRKKSQGVLICDDDIAGYPV